MRYSGIVLLAALTVFSGWSAYGQTPDRLSTEPDSLVIKLDYLSPTKDEFSFPLETPVRRLKIGLVLSGGGARGLAQIGVLKVLEREKIPIDCIAGTSMGGILGGLYAAGYSAEELEKIAKETDWNDLLTDTPPRLSLFLSQREEKEGSLFQFRLNGLKPYIPSALTSGQKLTNLFTNLAMRADFTSQWFKKPYSSFDNLQIPFRAVTTDLVTGQMVVLSSGDLALALRATMTIPLAFSPVEMGDKLLVDGGLIEPIPVQVAKDMGADVVIAVNTVSTLLPADKINNPFDVANQATSIMSLPILEEELRQADLVITPDLSGFSSMDFGKASELITRGEDAAENSIPEIERTISKAKSQYVNNDPPEFKICDIKVEGNNKIPTDSILKFNQIRPEETVNSDQIKSGLESIYAYGFFNDVCATLLKTEPEEYSLTYHVSENPVLRKVNFEGNTIYSDSTLLERMSLNFPRMINHKLLQQNLDSVIVFYHQEGYSLAHIQEIGYDSASGQLNVKINEGIVSRIELSGNKRTRNWVVMRNFPQKSGQPFNSTKVMSGLSNIYNTGLFEKVNFSTYPKEEGMVLQLKVKEQKFDIVRIGVHYNDEYQTEGFLQLVDANVFGVGNEVYTHFQYGDRRQVYRLNFKADRIFKTYLTYKLNVFYRLDGRKLFENHHTIGDFNQRGVGAFFSLGQHLFKLGTISVEARAENIKITDGIFKDKYNIRSLTLRSLVDTFDKYSFPSRGKYHHLYLEMAGDILGGDLVYRKAYTSLESYFPLHKRVSFHPKVAIGVSDGTVPISEKFTLGGIDNFYGLFSEELKGDKMLLGSLGLRFKFFRRWYWTLRYDTGKVWTTLESIKLKKLIHAFGSSLSVDTPIGPVEFAYGVATVPASPKAAEWDKFYFNLGFDF
jgi:NTE family protein